MFKKIINYIKFYILHVPEKKTDGEHEPKQEKHLVNGQEVIAPWDKRNKEKHSPSFNLYGRKYNGEW